MPGEWLLLSVMTTWAEPVEVPNASNKLAQTTNATQVQSAMMAIIRGFMVLRMCSVIEFETDAKCDSHWNVDQFVGREPCVVLAGRLDSINSREHPLLHAGLVDGRGGRDLFD